MTQHSSELLVEHVQAVNPNGTSSVVLVCEHASFFIPQAYQNLGLSQADARSHAAWDPGALAVAQRLSEKLDADLIAGAVSRLVFDCNRPPNAPDAMPERSEVIDIPGNVGLSPSQKLARSRKYYLPFHDVLAGAIESTIHPVIVTIHSFTPVYYGELRAVEIGVLHDSDSRLADEMLRCAATHTQYNVQRNQPYGPEHGVTHTLKEHGISGGHLNVMLEIRNDLIQTETAQHAVADMIADWVSDAFARTKVEGSVQCVA